MEKLLIIKGTYQEFQLSKTELLGDSELQINLGLGLYSSVPASSQLNHSYFF